MRFSSVILALLLLTPAFIEVYGDDKTVLIELDAKSSALPSAVSASGSVVVGSLNTGGGFYWMPTTGVIYTGGLGATGVSRDGRTIVGEAVSDRRVIEAAIWLRASEWRTLGSFASAAPCGLEFSSATDTTRDGKVVVGLARNGCTLAHAFRWEESTGMVDLGSTVPGRSSMALAVSADGQVVAGYQDRADGFRQGARWAGGAQQLLAADGGPVGSANAVNGDGSILVGRVCSPVIDLNQSAWIWTSAGGVQCLPVPKLRVSPGPKIIGDARATSDDGSVIGGSQNVGGSTDSDAVIWIDRQPAYLKDFLQANGIPDAFKTWINTGTITGISPDGRILVGWGAALGGYRGYIVILGTHRVMP